jgi:hypothetical protein
MFLPFSAQFRARSLSVVEAGKFKIKSRKLKLVSIILSPEDVHEGECNARPHLVGECVLGAGALKDMEDPIAHFSAQACLFSNATSDPFVKQQEKSSAIAAVSASWGTPCLARNPDDCGSCSAADSDANFKQCSGSKSGGSWNCL